MNFDIVQVRNISRTPFLEPLIMPDGLKKQNRLVLNDKGSFVIEFTLIFGTVLIIIVFMMGFALDQLSAPDGLKKGGKLLALALGVSLAVTSAYHWIAKFAGDGLFLSSSHQNEEEILKGLYKRAHGFRTANRFEASEKLYIQIMQDFPKELNALFYLADLLWREMDESKKALRKFAELEKRIKQDSLKFEFRLALKRNIGNIKEELKES